MTNLEKPPQSPYPRYQTGDGHIKQHAEGPEQPMMVHLSKIFNQNIY